MAAVLRSDHIRHTRPSKSDPLVRTGGPPSAIKGSGGFRLTKLRPKPVGITDPSELKSTCIALGVDRRTEME